MKLQNINIKEIIGKIKNLFLKKEYRTISDKARHDWKSMMIGFFVAGIILVVVSTMLFFRVSSGEQFIPDAYIATETKPFDEKALLESVEEFRNKKVHLEDLKQNPPQVSDPSL